jgi:hypothetical protein
LRTCTVSYQDTEGGEHSVEVTAETLYEAAMLGMKGLPGGELGNAPNLNIEVKVRAPETTHMIWKSVFAA